MVYTPVSGRKKKSNKEVLHIINILNSDISNESTLTHLPYFYTKKCTKS